MTLTANRTYSPLRAGCPRSHGTPDDGRDRSRKYHPGLLDPDKHLTSPEMPLPCSDETRARYERGGRRVSQSSNDGVSLNQWITAAVAQKIGAVETVDEFLTRRAAEANPGDLTRYLDAALDVPPEPGDEVQG